MCILEPGTSEYVGRSSPRRHYSSYTRVCGGSGHNKGSLGTPTNTIFLPFSPDFPQTARRVRGAIDSSYELAIRIRLFSLCIPMPFRYASGLYLMNLPCQLGRLQQIAEAWQLLKPTTRIRLQDFDFVQYFDPQGNIQDHSLFSILMILHYHPPRLIGRKTVMRERWTLVNEQCLIDGLEIVRLPSGSQGASSEADTLLDGLLHEEPRKVMSLGRSAFTTAVNPSARLLAMLTSEG